jgi:sugar transferase (PEP-CTERM system associated)
MIRLFRVSFPPSIVALFIIEAFLAVGAYVFTFQIRSSEDWVIWLLYEGGFDRVGLVVASILLGVYFNDLYSEIRVTSRVWLVQKFCLVFGIAFMSQALLSYLNPNLILGRWHMIIGSGIALVVMPSWRIVFDALVLRMLPSRTILFVGASGLVTAVAKELESSPHFAMTSVGYLAVDAVEGPANGLGPHLGQPGELKSVAERLKPDTIVVGLAERRNQLPIHDLLDLNISGTKVEEITSLYENVMWRVPVEAIRPSQMLFAGSFAPNENSMLLQRIYSFVFALLGVLATAPIMLAVWVLVRITSPGPAVYSQRRVGLKGKEFLVYKFRSMYMDAEARTGAVWATRNDPRITPVGRWLRLLRLDELPQFFNVLKGEMSIVGPRPERPEFVKLLTEKIPYYGHRHAVLPGITGWAQINHKYGDTLEDTLTKLEYDLYYLKNISLSLDLYVIFHTVKVMLLSRGAQ